MLCIRHCFLRRRAATYSNPNRLKPGDTLVVASHSEPEVVDVRNRLQGHGLHLLSLTDVGLPLSPPSHRPKPGHRAIGKAQVVSAMSGHAALVELKAFTIDLYERRKPTTFELTFPWPISATLAGEIAALGDYCDMICSCCAPRPDNLCVSATLVVAWPDGRYFSFHEELRGGWDYGPPGPPRSSSDHFRLEDLMTPDGEDTVLADLPRGKRRSLDPRNRVYAKLISEVVK